MAKIENDYEKKVLAKLDSMTQVLENLFILEASRANVNKKQIRQILGVAMERVTRVSKSVRNNED